MRDPPVAKLVLASRPRLLQQANAALESRNAERMAALASVLTAMNDLKCTLPAPATHKPPP